MSNGRCSPQPLLIEAGDRLKLRVLVQQGGAALESRRRNPGIGQGEAMAGFEFSCAQQQGLGGLQPVDRQGLELLKGHASHRRFPQLGDAIGTGLVVPEGEQS